MKPGLTALVVDDIEPMRKVASAQLNALGIRRVYTAANGVEALRMLQSHHVDVVLSDWNMPEMNGIELLRAMRADPHLASVPLVMITAESECGRIKEAIADGVSDLLVKPYTAGRLAQGIARAVSRRTPNPAPLRRHSYRRW